MQNYFSDEMIGLKEANEKGLWSTSSLIGSPLDQIESDITDIKNQEEGINNKIKLKEHI